MPHKILSLLTLLARFSLSLALLDCNAPGYAVPTQVRFGAVLPHLDKVMNNTKTTLFSSFIVEKALRAAIPLANERKVSGSPDIVLQVVSVDNADDTLAISQAVQGFASTQSEAHAPLAGLWSTAGVKGDQFMALLGEGFKTPVFSVQISPLELSNAAMYSMFFRMYPGVAGIATSFLPVFDAMQWRSVFIVTEGASFQLAGDSVATIFLNHGMAVTGPVAIPVPAVDREATYDRLWTDIASTQKRIILSLTSTPSFIQMVYYGALWGHVKPQRSPYVFTGSIYVHFQQLTLHAASLRNRSIAFNTRGASLDPLWQLPSTASFTDILNALKGVIIGRSSTNPSAEAVLPLAQSFQRIFQVPPTLQNDFTIYTSKVADALLFLRAGIDAAYSKGDLCNVVGHRNNLSVEHVAATYRPLRVQGASGPVMFAQTGRANVLEVPAFMHFHRLTFNETGISVDQLFTVDGFKNYELREASTDRAITEEQLRGLIQESMEFNFLTPQKAIPSDHYIPPPPPKPRDLVPIVVPATLIPTVVLGLVLIPLLVSNAKAKTLRKHVELSPDYFKTVDHGLVIPVRMGLARMGVVSGGHLVTVQELNMSELRSAPRSARLTKIRVETPPIVPDAKGGSANNISMDPSTLRRYLELVARAPSWSQLKRQTRNLRFEYELTLTLIGLKHRNVVQTLGIIRPNSHDQNRILVHEELSMPLRRKIASFRTLKLKRKLMLILDVVKGLEYLSQALPYGEDRPVLRRGCRIGHVWLDSFGVAKISGVLEDSTTTLLTPELLALVTAPEVIADTYVASEAGDVWFVGVLSFCLLSGIDSEAELQNVVQRADALNRGRTTATEAAQAALAAGTISKLSNPVAPVITGAGLSAPHAQAPSPALSPSSSSGATRQRSSVDINQSTTFELHSSSAMPTPQDPVSNNATVHESHDSVLTSPLFQTQTNGEQSTHTKSTGPAAAPASPYSATRVPQPIKGISFKVPSPANAGLMHVADARYMIAGAGNGVVTNGPTSVDGGKGPVVSRLPWNLAIHERLPQLPPGLFSILRRCTALNASDRPKLAEIAAVLGSRPAAFMFD